MATENPTSLTQKVDEQYMEVLFKTYFKGLCIFARQFVPDNDKVQDIVQDVFLNIWEKGEMLASESQVKGYLYTAVRNRCLNYIRDNKKFSDNVEVAHIENSDNSSRIEYRELDKLIRSAINELPEKCKEVFELSRFQDLKYQQIADTLGISVKTVEAQMTKALKVLREKLAGYTGMALFILQYFFGGHIRVNEKSGV